MATLLVCDMQVSHLDSSMIAAMPMFSVSCDDAFRSIIEDHIFKHIGSTVMIDLRCSMYSALSTLLVCGMHIQPFHIQLQDAKGARAITTFRERASDRPAVEQDSRSGRARDSR